MLDASGGGVFLNLLGAAEGASNRAAALTPPLAACHKGTAQRIIDTDPA
jgi:hypothetical protein